MAVTNTVGVMRTERHGYLIMAVTSNTVLPQAVET